MKSPKPLPFGVSPAALAALQAAFKRAIGIELSYAAIGYAIRDTFIGEPGRFTADVWGVSIVIENWLDVRLVMLSEELPGFSTTEPL